MTKILPQCECALPPDFAWHQSGITTMLCCPRRFQLRHVERLPLDHMASGYANLLGTADHAGIALILERANEGKVPARGELLDCVAEAFQEAIYRAQEHGEHTDPDSIQVALAKLEGQRLELLLRLADDPRIRGIRWAGVERKFEFCDAAGRRWKGTVDAVGVAQQDLYEFGMLGREPVSLRRGELVIVDWKTGAMPGFSRPERTQSVQLGVYAMAVNREWPRPQGYRTFLAMTQDLELPKAPIDAYGKRIPKKLPREINPEYVAAVDLPPEEAAKSKKRPRGISKWMPERLNPEWERATQQPKGPVFREARVNYSAVLETIRATVRQAELGIFPASGAATGQCVMCPYSRHCAQQGDEDE